MSGRLYASARATAAPLPAPAPSPAPTPSPPPAPTPTPTPSPAPTPPPPPTPPPSPPPTLASVRGITSAMARCPRMAAYRALNTPEPEPNYTISLYHRRGQIFERLRVLELQQAYGHDQVETQRLVHWETAGHRFAGAIDAYTPADKTIREIVSAVSPSPDTIGHKIEQAKQYLILDPEAERAVVDVIDPSRLAPADEIPVTVTDSDRHDLEQRIHQVGQALETGGQVMPPRVCARSSEARNRLCPFADTCFDGVNEPVHHSDDEAAVTAARRAVQVRQLRDNAKTALDQADSLYRQALDQLDPYVHDGDNQIGGIRVVRTPVRGRETFSLSLARRAGSWTAQHDEWFQAFLQTSDPHVRWTIQEDE